MMEEKKIVIHDKSENQILGQESVFGWEMAKKEPFNRFLFLKFFTYTLTRNRNEEDVTPTHKEVEDKWNNAFNNWSCFIQTTYKYLVIGLMITLIATIVGLVLLETGLSNMTYYDYYSGKTPGSAIAGRIVMIVSLVSDICITVFMMKPIKKLKKMDEISKEMRQVNAVRNNKIQEKNVK